MLRWHELIHRSDQELARLDVAAVNLACAEGLPDADGIDCDRILRKLDEWADVVRKGTQNVLPLFRRNPGEYENSEAYFRALAMVTVLKRNLGLRYHPAKQSDDALLDTADMFIHGAVSGDGGTCGTIPVVIVAVGRRLGYPLSLVRTKSHSFVRWDGKEVFNIEAACAGGMGMPTDQEMRRGRFEMPDETVRACGYLRSLSPREELACFLIQRAERWGDFGDYGQEALCFSHSYGLAPAFGALPILIDQSLRLWHAKNQRRLPPKPGFPQLDIGLPPQRFPHLPLEVEREMLCLKITEQLLDNPEYDRIWWEPMRCGQTPKDLPQVLRFDYRRD